MKGKVKMIGLAALLGASLDSWAESHFPAAFGHFQSAPLA